MSELSRREFLKAAGIGAVGVAIVACQPQTVIVKETVEVEKEKIVTQVVEVEKEVTKIVAGTPVVEKIVETKVVEKEITPTPVPAIVTSQGKELPMDAAPLEKQVWFGTDAENKHLDCVRDIYSANSALARGIEPMLHRNEMMELVPSMAESYEPSSDASYFDFFLRKNAMWDDGTPCTAHDWEYTYVHASLPELDTPWIWFYYQIKGIKAHKAGDVGPEGVGVKALDDYTVRIEGEAGPTPHLPSLLAYQASGCVPKHLAEENPAHWADEADTFVSCGQYSIVQWTHNKQEQWMPNQYYDGFHKPGIQRLFSYIGATEPLNMFLAKELDIQGVDQTNLRMFQRDPDLNALLHWFSNFQVDYMALNVFKPPLDKLKLRQALSHALDRDKLVDVLLGTILPGATILSPGFPGYNADLEQIQNFDLDLAKSLLAEAGYPEGKDANGNQLTLTLTHSGVDARCQFVQSQWQDNLGIKVDYELVDGATWGKLRSERAMQIYKGPYEYDYLDPINFLSLFQSVDDMGSPRHGWVNAEFDDLLNKGSTTVDDKERFAIYNEAEKLLLEQAAAIPLSHGIIFHAWWPYFTGAPRDVTGRVTYRYLDITKFQFYIRDDVDEWRPSGWLEKIGSPPPYFR